MTLFLYLFSVLRQNSLRDAKEEQQSAAFFLRDEPLALLSGLCFPTFTDTKKKEKINRRIFSIENHEVEAFCSDGHE